MKPALYSFLLALLMSTNAFAQTKASIQITRNINGKTEVITKEIDLQDGLSIEEIMSEMELLQNDYPNQDEQRIEIDIDREMNAGSRIYIGLELGTIENSSTGDLDCVVRKVMLDSPAEEAGFLEGDVILKVSGKSIHGSNEFIEALNEFSPNDLIPVEVYRNQSTFHELWVKAEEAPMNDFNSFFQPEGFNFDSLNSFFDFDQFFGQGMPFGEEQMWGEEDQSTPFLGVSPHTEEALKGVRIGEVIAESTAEEIGLKKGDILLEINKEKINSFDELSTKIKTMEVGDPLKLKVQRDGDKLRFEGVIGTKPKMKFGNNFVFPGFEGLNENGEWFFDFEFDGMPEDAFTMDGMESKGEIYIDALEEADLNSINPKRKSKEALSLDNTLRPKTLSLFPMGEVLEINFSLEKDETAQLLIVNDEGKTVAEYFLSRPTEIIQERIDFGALNGSNFYLQIKQGKEQFCRKIYFEK